ncbi:hypothetical protein L228DRAFT_265869 [Xylona heveae TC161]|uniref:Apple domain-containing protein n=1 Tax=Xylona heveae (strain CBS 132557 / TC161) TaxID=1328760 RepID=A0A165IUA6_XYLHT|nr:hypothetical protein L228DRAFT_265869 [Xylona heveae TC161]KZF25400.1 hypothetical protein L228DRAFT_265869 [Xylona heveae TC161]
MRKALIAAALLHGLARAAPHPQDIDFDAVDSAPSATVTGPPITAVEQPVTYNPTTASQSAAAAVTASPLAKRWEFGLFERDGVNDDCAPQPDGYGPKPTSDTTDAFITNTVFALAAVNAPTPNGYNNVFSNLQGSVSLPSYLGLYTLQSYDPLQCQQLCDAADSCYGFNIYFERDPSVNPADACPNPPSFTNIKCTLWGSHVTAQSASNMGGYRDQFQVVIAGSNGYNKKKAPPPYSGYDGPTELGGAIAAPLYTDPTTGAQVDTYIGVKFFRGAFNAGQCAAACDATEDYDRTHATGGSYKPCNFFNAYVLSKNGKALGTYCSLYTQPWDKSYSTNVGQYSGSDYYSVSQSYSYTRSVQDPGVVD